MYSTYIVFNVIVWKYNMRWLMYVDVLEEITQYNF